MRHQLAVNTVIQWIDSNNSDVVQVERVLWIDAIGEQLVVIALNDAKALPTLKNSEEYVENHSGKQFKIIEWIDQFNLPLEERDALPKTYLEKRDEAWEIIKHLVKDEPSIYDPRLRGIMIRELQERISVHKSTIYRYLRRYWQSGKVIDSLIPHYKNSGGYGKEKSSSEVKRGRPTKVVEELGGINITEGIKHSFQAGISLFYNTKNQPNIKRAYKKTMAKFFNIGFKVEGEEQIPILPPREQLPTYEQFYYWFRKKQDLEKSLQARIGKHAFNLKHRPILGSSTTESFGPGSRFQIDATVADIYLVNEFNREWIIGRPIIYIVMDVFSRIVTGFYVGLEGPSWIGAMMALLSTSMDKVKLCAAYGLDINYEDWPIHHLPEILLADRGEFEGLKPNGLRDSLGVDIELAAPYRADWKGVVEQQFRLLNLRSIKWIPGAVEARKRERGERDYRLDATLTLNEFTQVIIHSILYHNNSHYMKAYDRNQFMVANDVLPIPTVLWKWGVEYRNGRLKTEAEDIVKLALMPRGTATVTRSGIIFKGMSYSCNLAIREQWYTTAGYRGSWKVPVVYDVRNANEIYLLLNNGRSFEKCHLSNKAERYYNKRFEEIEELHVLEKQLGKEGAYNNLVSQIELDTKVEAITEKAMKETQTAIENSDLSKNKRLKDINKNRKMQKEENRKTEAFALGENEQEQNKESVSQSVQGEPIEYVAPAEKIDKLKSILAELDGEHA
ncbi:Mu transposase C-terminal domain-containing protein [Bacillus paranthracis]|uniref:Mu transposase C-terminal domain-containing protein n=1 Tax=Bacillus paranthracis TaxID=2026186 RepID=UPI0035593133